VLILVQTACGNTDIELKQKTEDEQPELEIWSFFDYNTPGTHYLDLWDELEETYGYKLNVKVFATEELKNKLRMALACGELPDIFEVWGGTFPEYLIDANACLPVQDYIEDSGIVYEDHYTYQYDDGNIYVIPCLVEAYAVCYYNNDLMEKIGLTIPTTWEELVEMVDQVTAYNEENGTKITPIGFGNKDAWLGELMYTMIVNRMDPFALEKLKTGELTMEDQLFVQAADDVNLLSEHQAFAEDFMQMGEVESAERFVNGETVMLPHQSTIMYYLMDNMGEDAVTMAQFPDCSGGTYSDYASYLMNANNEMTPGLCINSKTPYADEAAQICLDFSKRVNEINMTQYGYYNYIENETLEAPQELPALVEQFRQMLEGESHLTSFWNVTLPKDNVDSWQNLTKKLYAGSITSNDFVKEAAIYVNVDAFAEVRQK
jgi:raffinose/stachyose/melibiose transport system substrate-binding protein